jgi:hypothetical protein
MHGISKRTGVARAQPDWGESLAIYEPATQQEESVGLVIDRSELS